MRKEPLFEYQARAIDAAVSVAMARRRVVIALPTGAGKSRIIIEIINRFEKEGEKPVLVIAPRRIQVNSVWRQEVNKWSNTLPSRIISVDGKREPGTRHTLWRNARAQNYVVLSTPNIVSNDIDRGLLDINIFSLVIVDEAHHSIKRDSEGYRLAINYGFLNDYENTLIGIAPRRQDAVPLKIQKAAEVLGASLITDDTAKEKHVERRIVRVNDRAMMKVDEEINSRQARAVAIFSSQFPKAKFDFLAADKIIAGLGLQSSSKQAQLIRRLCADYLYLQIARRQLYEDAQEDAKRKIERVEGTQKIIDAMAALDSAKLKAMWNAVEEESAHGNPVIIFTRFRSTADKIDHLLRSRGVSCAKLYGGLYDYPDAELEKMIRKRPQALVTTQEMSGESLNLQYFRTIILFGNIANDFWRLQLEGRIRGGKVIELRYQGTKDDIGTDYTDTNDKDAGDSQETGATPGDMRGAHTYFEGKTNEMGNLREDKGIEALGMEIALKFENSQSRIPKDVSAQNLGYDIVSVAGEEKRFIEVKSRSSEEQIIMTQNEWLSANRLGDSYWLYVVTVLPDRCVLYTVQNPAIKLRPESRGFVQYVIDKWKDAAVEIGAFL